MRSLTSTFLLALCGLISVQAEVTFDDVRDKLPKVYSGQEGEGAPKYFSESQFAHSRSTNLRSEIVVLTAHKRSPRMSSL
jgi:hypothetical protein